MATMEFIGLKELIKTCDRLGGKTATDKANRNILKKAGKLTQNEAKKLAPRSKDPWLSGRKGNRTGEHMADKIPVSGVKNKNGRLFVIVGWDKGDNSPYFYAKFLEYGTSKIPANPFLVNALNKYKKQFNSIAEDEYNRLIKILE